jgi:hypothetical protein
MATRLRDAGLAWRPAAGDRFVVPDRDLDDTSFVLSDMTVEVHELPKGTVIGFNGTTEWALDDVDKDEALWLPREDQLRELLGPAFMRLDRVEGGYRVVVADEVLVEYRASSAPDAYATALLATLRGSADDVSGD